MNEYYNIMCRALLSVIRNGTEDARVRVDAAQLLFEIFKHKWL